MSKRWNRPGTWLALVAGAVGLLLLAVAGLHVYVTATAKPLHPDPSRISSVTRSDPAPQWAEAVTRGRQVARAALVDQNLPGLSVAVGVGSEVVWAEGFGWADLENRVPVTPDRRFRIGTASTMLTSAGVGVLLEQGRLTLDDPIQVSVPEFPKKQGPVTLRQLMGHLAGVGSDSGDEGPLFGEHCERPVEAFPFFAGDALRFDPGSDYRFSRYGWIVVSAAVEAAAKQPFLTFMRDQVFKPLGMAATEPDSATESVPNRVIPYFPRYAADPRYGPDPMRDLDYSCYAGASVFLSTPSDLVRFGMAINGGRLLKPATVQLLQTSQRLPSGKDTGYGLGWDLETVSLSGRPTVVVGHDGDSLGGTVATVMTFRERGVVVAVTSNTSYADTPAVALKIAEAFADPARRAAPTVTRRTP